MKVVYHWLVHIESSHQDLLESFPSVGIETVPEDDLSTKKRFGICRFWPPVQREIYENKNSRLDCQTHDRQKDKSQVFNLSPVSLNSFSNHARISAWRG